MQYECVGIREIQLTVPESNVLGLNKLLPLPLEINVPSKLSFSTKKLKMFCLRRRLMEIIVSIKRVSLFLL